MRLYTFLLILYTVLSGSALQAQDDETMLRGIFDKALKEGESYEMLEFLSKQIGARLSGSPEAAAAVEWSRQEMIKLGFDTVFLQEVMVPHWVRGSKEIVRITNSKKLGSVTLNSLALGNSVGTGPDGILAPVIEVNGLDGLKELDKKAVEGKIVFFNQAMNPGLIDTFLAYSGAVGQRVWGASEAAKLGAVAVIVRSLASNDDNEPHTGTLVYKEGISKIPAVAISTNDANLLSGLLREDHGIHLYIETHCKMLPDVLSYNVIGELRGAEFPDEYIVVGGHLDSWDVGDGSHDDGAGCVQSIEVLRIFKQLNYQPKRTIRAVMFMNEENGLRGGKKYAEDAVKNREKHIAAIESDRGGFTPRGFTLLGTDDARARLMQWKSLFAPYGIQDFGKEGGGADIGPLASQGTTLIGFLPDPQRYFNYHHASADTFDKVDKRELELGAASMAALVYLIDKYGIDAKN